jgi:hypothetical protein
MLDGECQSSVLCYYTGKVNAREAYPMGWVRANRRSGSVVALLALVIQFALTLGHVHLVANGGTTALPIALAQTALAHTDKTSDEGAPRRSSDGVCDICAVLHMANAMQVPAAPVLAAPVAFVPIVTAIPADSLAPSSRQFLPQSRAPPAA